MSLWRSKLSVWKEVLGYIIASKNKKTEENDVYTEFGMKKHWLEYAQRHTFCFQKDLKNLTLVMKTQAVFEGESWL